MALKWINESFPEIRRYVSDDGRFYITNAKAYRRFGQQWKLHAADETGESVSFYGSFETLADAKSRAERIASIGKGD